MIEEDVSYLEKEVENLKSIISYLVEKYSNRVQFEHLEDCLDNVNLWKCSCGATQLNRLVYR